MASWQVRQRDPLLDQNTQAMLERRGRELLGLGFVAVGLAFMLIFATYSPEDPGWMVATDAPAHNALGRFGAAIASTLIIIGGKGVWALPVLFLAWGARFVTHRGADRAVGRVVFGVVAVALCSVFAATLIPSANWPHSFGLGGLFGDTVLGAMLGVAPVKAGVGLVILSLVLAAAMIAMMLFVTGFDLFELRVIGHYLGIGSVMAYNMALNAAGKGARGAGRAAQGWQDRQREKRATAAAQPKARAAVPAQAAQGFAPPPMAAQAGRGTGLVRRAAPPEPVYEEPLIEDEEDEDYDALPSVAPSGWGRAAPLRADTRYSEPLAEAPHYVQPREKLGLLSLVPGLIRRTPDPLPELVEPEPLPVETWDAPSPDRISNRISEVVKSRTKAPVQGLTPLQAAIQSRREPPMARPRGPIPLIANTARRPAAPGPMPMGERVEPPLVAPPAAPSAPLSSAPMRAASAAASAMGAALAGPARAGAAAAMGSVAAGAISGPVSGAISGAAAAMRAAATGAASIGRAAGYAPPPAPPAPEAHWQDEDAIWQDEEGPLYDETVEVLQDSMQGYEAYGDAAYGTPAPAARAPQPQQARAAYSYDDERDLPIAADWQSEDAQSEYEAEDQQGWQDESWDEEADEGYDIAAYAPSPAPRAMAAPDRRAVVQHPGMKKPALSTRAVQEAQPRLRFEEQVPEYELPPLSLLTNPATIQRHTLSNEALEENARMLESVLDDYGVKGEIVSVRPGPVVTMYELEPAPGLKASRVIGLADDIARSMSALSARVSTVPGRSVIGIELPNVQREKVVLREILAARDFGDTQMRLPLALGKDIGGDPIVANLAKMPHLLIAGTTGSGKSVAINTMILSLLYKLTPEECRLIMIDPKMLELSVYDGIPHLLSPVVTDPKKAVVALKWVVGEMEERYRKMSKMGVRNIEGYNGRVREALDRGEMFKRTIQTGFDEETGDPVFETEEIAPQPFPYIVVIVDEMADLMMVAGKEIEACIQRLAQMARASGIHLIMATQRPSVDVITGTIKANFPTRISFQVTSKIDSRTILGEMGAEQLLGMGDMLYMAGGGRISRIHGPFVSDEEVEEIVNHLKSFGPPTYMAGVVEGPDEDVASDIDTVLGLGGNTDGEDALYDQAVAIVAKDRKCSTSYIQRKLGIGYNKAARLVEQMEEQGVVTPANHVGKREILIPEA